MAGVYAAVHKAIAELPEERWTSVDATVALTLAEALDNQVGGAAAAKELRSIMASLCGEVEPPEASKSDDLRAKRAARLADAAGQ